VKLWVATIVNLTTLKNVSANIMGEIAGMWLCDNCETIAYVSVEADILKVTQCACVMLSRTTNNN
jgi:hypothetical protein